MSTTTAPAWRYGNLVAAIATIASCDIALGFTFQLLPLLMEMQHIPAWIIGLNTAMGPIGILLAGPVLPRIISRFGPKRVAYICVVFIMAALALFKLLPSLYVWFPLRFALGIATGALFTISEAWILTFAGAGSRGRIMGIYTSVMAISFSLGPFALPFTGTTGWLPWLIGIICLGLSILPLTLVSVSDDAFYDKDGGNFLRVIKRAPLLLFAVCTATLFDTVFISFFTIFGLRSGLTLQTASWVLGAGILGNLGLQFLIGSLSDRWSRIGVVVCSAIVTVVTCVALIFVVNSWLIWPTVVIMATAAFSVYVVALAIMGDTFKGADLIAGSAAFSAMWGVGGLVGPPMAGAAIDAFGVNSMPLLLAAFYVLLLVGLALTADDSFVDKQRIINLFAAISTITVFGFALGLMFPLLALIMEKRGIDPDIIGYNTAMQPLGIMLSVFTTPILVRKFGAKRATIGAAFATGTVILFYPFLSVFWWWFALRILHGFFVSTLFAISEAWIVKFAEGPYRSRILALYTSVLAASFGGGPVLISFTGIDTALPFVIGATVLAVATVPIFFVKDENIDDEDEDPLSVIGFIRKAPILLIAVGMFAIIDAANLSFLPVYGVKKGLDQATASLALTAFIIGNTVLQFPIGWLADHFRKRWVMAGCGVVTACASALLPLSFQSWVFWPLLTIAGAASAGIYTVSLAELGERFSGHELVTGTASFSTTWGLGALVGSLIAGWSMQSFGPDGLPYSMAMIFALFLLVMVAREYRARS